jgi:CheY-like chemotaxis protein
MRRILTAIAVAAVMATATADLDACGDKFLRVGRSARFRRYAAVHPAAILIYAPADSTPAGIKEFEAILKRAGHRTVALANGADVSQALVAAPYDLVIADYSDSNRIREHLRAAASKAGLLPILYKPSKAVAEQAEREFACLIKPHAMTKYDALAEIDRLMQLRQQATPAAPHSD